MKNSQSQDKLEKLLNEQREEIYEGRLRNGELRSRLALLEAENEKLKKVVLKGETYLRELIKIASELQIDISVNTIHEVVVSIRKLKHRIGELRHENTGLQMKINRLNSNK